MPGFLLFFGLIVDFKFKTDIEKLPCNNVTVIIIQEAVAIHHDILPAVHVPFEGTPFANGEALY